MKSYMSVTNYNIKNGSRICKHSYLSICLPYRVDSVVTTLYDGFADNDMLSSVVGAELCGLSPVA